MRSIVKKLKNILKRIKGALPSPLPQGLNEFNEWIADFIDTYNPAMNERSVKFAVATMMMRLNPTEAYKPKRYFALCLHKGAAAEVSNYVMHLVKQEQEAENKAQEEAAKASSTAANVEISN
jgi:hypothetical protein